MKVFPFKIPKPSNEKLIVQHDKGRTFYERLHQHEEIQLSYLLKGSGKLIIGDSVHPYGTGEFFVIGSELPHLFQSAGSAEDSHMISIFFTKETLGAGFFELHDLQSIKSLLEASAGGLQICSDTKPIKEIVQRIAAENKLNRIISFLKLLGILAQSETKTLTEFVNPKVISTNEGQRLQIVYEYVTKNFHEQLQLKTVAEMAFMTPNAFCRFFKQRTNKTFFEFLIDVRVAHACQLILKSEDVMIADIARASGFNSVSNFNRKFKKIKKCTPSDYRKSSNVFDVSV